MEQTLACPAAYQFAKALNNNNGNNKIPKRNIFAIGIVKNKKTRKEIKGVIFASEKDLENSDYDGRGRKTILEILWQR